MSLLHVNRVYNTRYGYRQRRVVAHMPLLLNTRTVRRMQAAMPQHFANVSRNRFRTGTDMQFAFTYMYYLMSESRHVSVEEIFAYFDTDNSGTWSDREIRTLLTRLHELPLDYEMVNELEQMLVNCSRLQPDHENIATPQYERYLDSNLPTITKQLVAGCEPLVKIMLEKFGTVKYYKYEIMKNVQSNYVTFKMLTSNLSQVIGNLDEIRKYPKKFVCLNDNMHATKSDENNYVKTILNDFYISLFPTPSKFELPAEYRNRFTHMAELQHWRRTHHKLNIAIFILIYLLLMFCVCNICKFRFCNKIKRYFC